MTPSHTLVRAALAAALGCAAAMAQAQTLQSTFTLVSGALPMASEFACTLTNVSNQTVTVNLLQIVYDGVALTNVNASCNGPLAAGQRCTVRTDPTHITRHQFVPHCRARFTATQSGAVVGMFRSSYVDFSGSPTYDLAVLPMQALLGVTLGPPIQPSL